MSAYDRAVVNDKIILDLIETGKIVVTEEGHIYNSEGSRIDSKNYSTGYMSFRIPYVIDGVTVRKTFRSHRAVYLKFYGPIPYGYQIDHDNDVKDDNCYRNLKAVTQSTNISKRDNSAKARLSDEKIKRAIEMYYFEGVTQGKIGEFLGRSQRAFQTILVGRTYKNMQSYVAECRTKALIAKWQVVYDDALDSTIRPQNKQTIAVVL